MSGVTNQKVYLDRGRRFDVEDVSGIMAEPPIPGAAYTVLLPQVDADGNPIDGLRNTNVQVPLGTYTGWNIRKPGFSEGDSCDLTGGFIPFFKTKAEREAAGDPRLSLEERYPTHDDYVAKVTAAANDLVSKRLLLPEDAAQHHRRGKCGRRSLTDGSANSGFDSNPRARKHERPPTVGGLSCFHITHHQKTP